MTLEHEVRAKLADRYAAMADLASSEGNGRELLQAGEKLLELLDTLPVRTSGGGGSGDDGGGERSALLGVIHGGPAVGDSADS